MRRLMLVICLAAFQAVASEASSPLDKKLPENALTEVSCLKAGQKSLSHYHVWLPPGYHEQVGRLYPFLLIDNANGRSVDLFANFKDWAVHNEVIVIMPVELKNGDFASIERHIHALFEDLPKRFRLAKAGSIYTGFSGGSRRAGIYSDAWPEWLGGVLHSAAVETDYSRSPHIFSASVLGDHDGNVGELQAAVAAFGDQGYYRLFEGGHNWYPKDEGEAALDWLLWSICCRATPAAPESMAKAFIQAQQARLKSASPLTQVCLLRRAGAVSKAHPKLLLDTDLKPFLSSLPGELQKLETPELLGEVTAMGEFEEIRDRLCIRAFAAAMAPVNPQNRAKVRKATEEVRRQASAALTALIEKHPGKQASKAAQKELERLARFESHWK